MTFSIVAGEAADPGGPVNTWGVAVASKFLAVGALVPAAEAGAGAVATQAWPNLRYRPDGLALLRSGRSAGEAVERLTAADPGRADRQLGIVDAAGQGATYTGADTMAWSGGVAGDGYAVQGNLLAGAAVVEDAAAAWSAGDRGDTMARRLLAALAAGDRAGGDARGRQSAALLVVRAGAGYAGDHDVMVDLRVDDHPDPVGELARLLAIHELLFTPADPATALPLTGTLALEVRDRLSRLGFPTAAEDDDGLDRALATWAGRENYEMRLIPRSIDPAVLAALRETG